MPEVAARKDPRNTGLYRESEAFRLAGNDPNYVYERKSLDQRHPNYVGHYLREHEIGNAGVGFMTVKAWEVVEAKDSNHPALRKRPDEGKDLDTTVQRGGQILVRLHKDEHRKYRLIDDLNDKMRSKFLSADRKGFGKGVSMKGGVEAGTQDSGADDVNPQDIINRA